MKSIATRNKLKTRSLVLCCSTVLNKLNLLGKVFMKSFFWIFLISTISLSSFASNWVTIADIGKASTKPSSTIGINKTQLETCNFRLFLTGSGGQTSNSVLFPNAIYFGYVSRQPSLSFPLQIENEQQNILFVFKKDNENLELADIKYDFGTNSKYIRTELGLSVKEIQMNCN